MEPPGAKRTYEEIVGALLERLQQGGVITDVNPGSVARTLAEAFAREMADAYARLGQIYDAGFLESATAAALDSVVALLGMKRVAGKQATCDAIFHRDMRVRDRVEIPEGTELLVAQKASKKEVTYRTMSRASLDVDQKAVMVPIAVDIPPGADARDFVLTAADLSDARQVSSLAAVARVQIARATAVREHRESDEELRERAKKLVVSAGGGTFRAIQRAVLATGLVKSVSFRDKTTPHTAFLPGELEVAVDADLTNTAVRQTILDAINSSKGPGIYVTLIGVAKQPVFIEITAEPVANLTREKRQVLRQEMEETVQAAFAALQPGGRLLWNPVQAKLLGLNGVMDLVTVSVASSWPPQPVGRTIPDDSVQVDSLVRLAPPSGGPAAVVRFADEILVRVSVTLAAPAEPGEPQREALRKGLGERLSALNDGASEPLRRLSFADVDKVVSAIAGLAGARLAAVHIEVQGTETIWHKPEDALSLRPGFRFYLDQSAPTWEAGS